jgi:hypothetical protein
VRPIAVKAATTNRFDANAFLGHTVLFGVNFAGGPTVALIAKELGVAPSTVMRWYPEGELAKGLANALQCMDAADMATSSEANS